MPLTDDELMDLQQLGLPDHVAESLRDEPGTARLLNVSAVVLFILLMIVLMVAPMAGLARGGISWVQAQDRKQMANSV